MFCQLQRDSEIPVPRDSLRSNYMPNTFRLPDGDCVQVYVRDVNRLFRIANYTEMHWPLQDAHPWTGTF